MKISKEKNEKTFTLVELLTLVVIFGVLIIVGIPTYNNYVENAKDQAFKTQIQQWKNFLNTESVAYSMDNTKGFLKNYSIIITLVE